MAKLILTTAVHLLIITAAVGLAALPPTRAQPSSEPSPAPPAAPPPDNCFNYLLNLADCLDFVDNGSTLSKPDPACCPELDNLISKQPICLCEMLSNSTQFDLSIDKNRALQLPSLCDISTTSPVSLCAVIGVPVAAPTPSSSTASPAPGNDENGSPTILLPSNQHFLIGLAVVLYTSMLLLDLDMY